MQAYTYSKEEILKKLNTNENGLSNNRIKELQKQGLNEIVNKNKNTLFDIVYKQLKDKMVITLLIAAIFSFILGEKSSGIVILIIIVINVIISSFEENKALKAVQALKEMNALNALVKRDGVKQTILAKNLVVGDIVYLEAGNIVPADMRLLSENNLMINESALTGESTTVAKNEEIVLPAKTIIAQQLNMVFASSVVTDGTAVGVVTSIGMQTEVGKIAKMLENTDDLDTPLKRKLNAVGTTLSIVGIIISIIIFVVGLLYGKDLVTILMIAVSLAISVIPEGLPAIATIVMALGVQRMAKKNALVKELPAVETLGSASCICTDKTGTLTINKMTVENTLFYPNLEQSKPTDDFLKALILCNNASRNIGDPTEVALLNFASEKLSILDKYPRVFEKPFDSKRKMMSVINLVDGKYICYTKGALEEILNRSVNIVVDGKVVKLTEKIKNEILEKTAKYLENAERLLAFAKKEVAKLPSTENVEFENNLTFLGIATMIDPPRETVSKAINSCKNAGIKVIMITGDHKLTGFAIAKKNGILEKDSEVLTGKELITMDDKQLKKVISKVRVFARVSPEDKMRIIRILKETGEVVAMTGDGVNDAPALKMADIGIAMGKNGTDVARNSADMILLDDNFETIEYAVREGRRIYKNIQKVIGYLLSGNIAEILVIFLGILLNYDAPLLAVHILFVNLVTDTLPALALGVDPEDKNIMSQKPVKGSSLFEKGLIKNVLLYGFYIAFIALVAYKVGINNSYKTALTMTFLVLCLSQIFHALNVGQVFSKKNIHNQYLYLAMLMSICLLLIVYVVPITHDLFSLTLLGQKEWLLVLALSISPLMISLIKK